MTFRELIPSYLENNHIGNLRHQLCEIIYDDYKGTTFFLDKMLQQKINCLNEVYNFIKENPELLQYKNNSQYWYPYEDVDGSKNLSIYRDFYPNKEDEITYFYKKDELNKDKNTLFYGYDYLFDPAKLHFILMCKDISQMDCNSPNAKEILKVNNELFKVLFDIVGDTISYSNDNTIEHMQKYIQSYFDEQERIENDFSYDNDFKTMLLRDSRKFTDNVALLNQAFIVCNHDKLEKELPVNVESKITKKKI